MGCKPSAVMCDAAQSLHGRSYWTQQSFRIVDGMAVDAPKPDSHLPSGSGATLLTFSVDARRNLLTVRAVHYVGEFSSTDPADAFLPPGEVKKKWLEALRADEQRRREEAAAQASEAARASTAPALTALLSPPRIASSHYFSPKLLHQQEQQQRSSPLMHRSPSLRRRSSFGAAAGSTSPVLRAASFRGSNPQPPPPLLASSSHHCQSAVFRYAVVDSAPVEKTFVFTGVRSGGLIQLSRCVHVASASTNGAASASEGKNDTTTIIDPGRTAVIELSEPGDGALGLIEVQSLTPQTAVITADAAASTQDETSNNDKKNVVGPHKSFAVTEHSSICVSASPKVFYRDVAEAVRDAVPFIFAHEVDSASDDHALALEWFEQFGRLRSAAAVTANALGGRRRSAVVLLDPPSAQAAVGADVIARQLSVLTGNSSRSAPPSSSSPPRGSGRRGSAPLSRGTVLARTRSTLAATATAAAHRTADDGGDSAQPGGGDEWHASEVKLSAPFAPGSAGADVPLHHPLFGPAFCFLAPNPSPVAGLGMARLPGPVPAEDGGPPLDIWVGFVVPDPPKESAAAEAVAESQVFDCFSVSGSHVGRRLRRDQPLPQIFIQSAYCYVSLDVEMDVLVVAALPPDASAASAQPHDAHNSSGERALSYRFGDRPGVQKLRFDCGLHEPFSRYSVGDALPAHAATDKDVGATTWLFGSPLRICRATVQLSPDAEALPGAAEAAPAVVTVIFDPPVEIQPRLEVDIVLPLRHANPLHPGNTHYLLFDREGGVE